MGHKLNSPVDVFEIQLKGRKVRRDKRSPSNTLTLETERQLHESRQYRNALNKAGERVGRTPFQAMAWLLRFQRADFESMSLTEREAVYYDITYFSLFGPYGGKPLSPLALLLAGEGKSIWQNKLLNGRYSFPSLKEAKAIKTLINRYLNDMAENKTAVLKFSKHTVRLNRSNVAPAVEYSSLKDAFLSYVVILLRHYGPQLRTCMARHCKNVFLAERRNHRFCCDPCQWRAAKQRTRLSHSTNPFNSSQRQLIKPGGDAP